MINWISLRSVLIALLQFWRMSRDQRRQRSAEIIKTLKTLVKMELLTTLVVSQSGDHVFADYDELHVRIRFMILGRIKIKIAVSHQLELTNYEGWWYLLIRSDIIFVSRVKYIFRDCLTVFSFSIVSPFVFFLSLRVPDDELYDCRLWLLRIQYTRSISIVRLHHERSCPVCQGKRLVLSRHVSGTRPYFLQCDGDEFCDLGQRRHSDPKYNHLVKKRQIWFVDDKTTRSDWVILKMKKRRSQSTMSAIHCDGFVKRLKSFDVDVLYYSNESISWACQLISRFENVNRMMESLNDSSADSSANNRRRRTTRVVSVTSSYEEFCPFQTNVSSECIMFYIRVFTTIHESIACRVLLNYIISTIKSRQSSFEFSTQSHVHPEKIIFLQIKSAIFWMNLVTRALSSIIFCTRICQASQFRREANETCAQRLLCEMRLHCSSTTLIRYVSHSASYWEAAISVKIVSFSNFIRVNDFTIW